MARRRRNFCFWPKADVRANASKLMELRPASGSNAVGIGVASPREKILQSWIAEGMIAKSRLIPSGPP